MKVTPTRFGISQRQQSGDGRCCSTTSYQWFAPGWTTRPLGANGNPRTSFGSSGQPDSMSVIGIMSSYMDNGGVHISSGIPNHAAYLITKCGHIPWRHSRRHRVRKAKVIYDRTQTIYNTPFYEFRQCGVEYVPSMQRPDRPIGSCRRIATAFQTVGPRQASAGARSLTRKSICPLVLNNVPTRLLGIGPRNEQRRGGERRHDFVVAA